MTTPEALLHHLRAKGMSQATLARELGVSRATVTDWVKGNKHPRGNRLEKVAAVFGLSLSEFFSTSEAA